MRREWSEYECNSRDWATISFLGRSPVKTIKRLVDAWSAAERVLIDTGYGKASLVGSYACRNIAGSASRSLHAFRLALDIDPSLNSRQGRGATMDWERCRITRHQVVAVEAIRTNSGAQVFRNGYVFGNPDPMHFQIACRKADLDTGIDWSTVLESESVASFREAAGTTPNSFTPTTAPSVEPKEDILFCQHGDGMNDTTKSETVKYWQTKLVALGQDTGGVDGRYGDRTKTAVQAVVAGSTGMRIGGEEAAQIDVTLARLGPAGADGVSHQHDEYSPTEHSHID
jgi:hypothetical protein